MSRIVIPFRSLQVTDQHHPFLFFFFVKFISVISLSLSLSLFLELKLLSSAVSSFSPNSFRLRVYHSSPRASGLLNSRLCPAESELPSSCAHRDIFVFRLEYFESKRLHVDCVEARTRPSWSDSWLPQTVPCERVALEDLLGASDCRHCFLLFYHYILRPVTRASFRAARSRYHSTKVTSPSLSLAAAVVDAIKCPRHECCSLFFLSSIRPTVDGTSPLVVSCHHSLETRHYRPPPP